MASSYELNAFTVDGLGQNRSGGGAVTSNVRGLGSNFLDQLRAHVLEVAFQLNLFSNGDAVLGDQRSAKALGDNDVAALGAKGDFYCVGKGVDPFQN